MENQIILWGFEPVNLAQEILQVVGEAVSLTQRTDIGQACANLLEVAGQCLNQEGEPPEVEGKLKAAGLSWDEVRNHLETVMVAARYADSDQIDQAIVGFLAGWNAITGDDLTLTDPLPVD
jgi:hypothetical protein